MPHETLEKIYELATEGAKIIFVDQYPGDVPGLNDLSGRRQKFMRLISRFPRADFQKTARKKTGKGEFITGTDYPKLFETAKIGHESFVQEFRGQLVRRKNETGHHYFFTLLADNEIDGWVPLAVKARSAMFFNPMDGKSGKALLRKEKGKAEVIYAA